MKPTRGSRIAALLLGVGGFTVPGALTAGDQAFDLFPVGKPWSNVRIPRYDEKDQLTSIMHTESLTREDQQRLLLDGLTLVMFEASGSLAMRLKTKSGVYDVEQTLLKTHHTTYIEHPQFDMKGDRMRFDTSKQEGKLEGNVEMRIYNVPMSIPDKPAKSDPNPPKRTKERKGQMEFALVEVNPATRSRR